MSRFNSFLPADGSITYEKLNNMSKSFLLGIDGMNIPSSGIEIGAMTTAGTVSSYYKYMMTTDYIVVPKGTNVYFEDYINYKFYIAQYALIDKTVTKITNGGHTALTRQTYVIDEDCYVRISIARAEGTTPLTTNDIAEFISKCFLFKPKANGIPIYWQSHVDNKISEIRNIQKHIGKGCFSLPFITDQHYPINEGRSPHILAEVMRKCDIKYCLIGGDIVDYDGTKAEFLDLFNTVKDSFTNAGITSYLYTVGNHDRNGFVDNEFISFNELYFFNRPAELLTNISMSDDGFYYYIDDNIQKIRIIVLNSSDSDITSQYDYAYRQEQIDWLITALKSLPTTDWSTVICSHVPPTLTNMFGSDSLPRNNDIVLGVVDAFKNKTTYSESSSILGYEVSVNVDFTTDLGDVLFWICGHTHCDNLAFIGINNNIPVLNTAHNASRWVSESYKQYSPEKIVGTISEHIIDIIVTDIANKIAHMIRIGAGVNRTVHLLSANVAIAGTIPLTSTLAGTLEWHSSNTNIATVIDGVVTGQAAGLATIKGIDENNNFEIWNIIVS